MLLCHEVVPIESKSNDHRVSSHKSPGYKGGDSLFAARQVRKDGFQGLVTVHQLGDCCCMIVAEDIVALDGIKNSLDTTQDAEKPSSQSTWD